MLIREQRLQIDLHGRDHSHVHCISTTPRGTSNNDVTDVHVQKDEHDMCVDTRTTPS